MAPRFTGWSLREATFLQTWPSPRNLRYQGGEVPLAVTGNALTVTMRLGGPRPGRLI